MNKKLRHAPKDGEAFAAILHIIFYLICRGRAAIYLCSPKIYRRHSDIWTVSLMKQDYRLCSATIYRIGLKAKN